jgi:integration host factor subunit beta
MSDSEPKTITKRELVQRIAERTGQTKVIVKEVMQHFMNEIIDELAQGNRIEFREFGVFEVRDRAARRAQNPRTLQKVQVPARRVVKFKIGRLMRQRVCGDGDFEEEDEDDELPPLLGDDPPVSNTPSRSQPPAASTPPRPPPPPPSSSPF